MGYHLCAKYYTSDRDSFEENKQFLPSRKLHFCLFRHKFQYICMVVSFLSPTYKITCEKILCREKTLRYTSALGRSPTGRRNRDPDVPRQGQAACAHLTAGGARGSGEGQWGKGRRRGGRGGRGRDVPRAPTGFASTVNEKGCCCKVRRREGLRNFTSGFAMYLITAQVGKPSHQLRHIIILQTKRIDP